MNRRDAPKAAAGLGLTVVGKADGQEIEAPPFDWSRYESFSVTMMFAADVTDDEAATAILGHMVFGKPIPREHEWARARCRNAIRTLLSRLDSNAA